MGGGVGFRHIGNFDHLEAFIARVTGNQLYKNLDQYGQLGVEALRSVTPKESGETANSWYYTVDLDGSHSAIQWNNYHMAGGTPVVILLTYGHGTGTGGYVRGRNFINPAIESVFDEIADAVWRKVIAK